MGKRIYDFFFVFMIFKKTEVYNEGPQNYIV